MDIEIKTGKYPCSVSTCVGENCVHDWIPYFCPCCDHQLVKVKTNGHVFCSNHELFCDYGKHIRNKKQFQTIDQVMARKYQSLLNQEKIIKRELAEIRRKINDYNNK